MGVPHTATHSPHRRPGQRSEEHTSELQSRFDLVCRLLLEKKKIILIKLLPILRTISIKKIKLMVLDLICIRNKRQDIHTPNCMFSCLQILEAFLWFVLITLLNVTLIILTLSVSRLLNLLLRLVAFLLFLNPHFFFYRYSYIPDLHSFPTRRSSD